MLAAVALTPLLAMDNEPAKRLGEAASPGLKTAAFVFGGKYGKGYLSWRDKSGMGWSAPGTVRIEGGSVGFQIGGSQTDLIMLVMSERDE